MKKILIGSVLAAAAVFLWGFLFWAVLAEVDQVSSEQELALQEALAAHVPKTGTYMIPGKTEDESVYTERHQAGPIAMISIRKEGSEPMSAGSFIAGFLHEFIFAVLIGLMLRMALPALPTYGARLGFVVLAGLTASFFFEFADPIWWSHPWGFHLTNFAYSLVAWALTGAILALFVSTETRMRRTSEAAPATAA